MKSHHCESRIANCELFATRGADTSTWRPRQLVFGNRQSAVLILAALILNCASAQAQSVAPSPQPDEVRQLQQKVRDLQHEVERLRQEAPAGAQEMQAGRLHHNEDNGLFRIMPANITEWVWFLAGMAGEFVFFLRFVVQWIASERMKRTIVPMAFWHLSLVGTAMVLAYAIYKLDPVFILAYSLNIFIYVRNLSIARRHQETQAVMEKTAE